jgi:hypothetical protein
MQHQQVLSQLKPAAPILAGNLSAIPLFGDDPGPHAGLRAPR